MRIRDHHRDCALQALAESLRVSKIANDEAQSTTKRISQLPNLHQECAATSRINVAQLQELRTIREGLQAELTVQQQQLNESLVMAQQAQRVAALRDSEREILIRLSERYEMTNRIKEQRQEEQILSESVVALCNGEHSA